jgi:hypothetical protein
LELDESETLAGRFKSVSARHYVLNDPEKLSGEYISAWQNFGVNSFNIVVIAMHIYSLL